VLEIPMLIKADQNKLQVVCEAVAPSPPKKIATRGQAKKLLGRIAAAHLAGKKNVERRHIVLFLNSYEARLTAVIRAAKQMPKGERPAPAQIKAIAQKLDPWKGTNEPVAVSFKKKKSNPDKRRITMKFGIENRALQYLILMVLERTADLHPHQYATRGGVHAAIKRVAAALTDGYVYVVELDIKDCYPSFVEEAIPNLLPLPKKVTEHIATCRHLNLTAGNLDDLFGIPLGTASIFTTELLAQARHGIPQGSAASNLIADILLSNVANQSPIEGRVFSYADNILLMAKDEVAMQSTKLALGSALKAHPAGPLVPTAKHFKLGEPIDFLGHRLSLKHGVVRIDPAPWKVVEFEAHVQSGLSFIKDKTILIKRRAAKVKALRKYVCGWTAALKCCHNIGATKDHWLAKLATAEKVLLIPGQSQLSAS
jgi:hypothetical protein